MAYAAFSTAYTPEPTRCAGGAKPGAVALQSWICDESPWAPDLYNLGIYVCRTIAGSSKLSSHASGRAGDSGCKVDPAPNPAGTALAKWLAANHAILGCQEIIWDRRRWDNQAKAWRAYNGQSPHLDHVHWSLNSSGGTYLTRARILSVAPGATPPPPPPPPPPPKEDDVFFYDYMSGTTTVLVQVAGSKQIRVTGATVASTCRSHPNYIGQVDAAMRDRYKTAFGSVAGV